MVACYSAGLPFFARTLASDLFYSGVLFGLHAWLSRPLAYARGSERFSLRPSMLQRRDREGA
jgi:hypothetical protein